MLVKKTPGYNRSKKSFKAQSLLTKIDSTENLLSVNHLDASLDFKKIICKVDKKRHSIKVPGTQYRILLTYDKNSIILVCVCTHDKYQLHNKRC